VEIEIPFNFQCLGSFKGHGAAVWALASLNNVLFTASADETIKCWDLSRMACVQTLKGHQGDWNESWLCDELMRWDVHRGGSLPCRGRWQALFR
jgi:WD40 repeat protein